MKKIISFLLACLIGLALPLNAAAADTTTEFAPATQADTAEEPTTLTPEETAEQAKQEAQKTLKEQRAELKQKIKENKEKLEQFAASAEATEAYIDTLDEKIGYLNEELNLLDKEVAEAQEKMDTLNAQIAPLEKELKTLQKQYDEAKARYDALQDKFQITHRAYCLRARALYISGNSSILAALLTSEDMAQFFNRLEMVRAVSKSDAALLETVTAQMENILHQQDGLNERKAVLEQTQNALTVKRNEYAGQQATVQKKQAEIAAKKITLSEDRAESDRLFAEYTAKTQLYTEFRNEDEALIQQVDEEINALLGDLKKPEEVTTAVASEHNGNKTPVNENTSENTLFSQSNAALSLAYPVKGHRAVSASFGRYSNGRPHSGIDYPCPVGSKIVAAQKGIVITVKRLNYSYGYYVMVYHGTDAKGRKIVTLYAHNSSILVSVGQTVRKGQQIAKSGSTGNSTGPHCHFELIIDGVKVNAKNYLG